MRTLLLPTLLILSIFVSLAFSFGDHPRLGRPLPNVVQRRNFCPARAIILQAECRSCPSNNSMCIYSMHIFKSQYSIPYNCTALPKKCHYIKNVKDIGLI